MTSFDEPNWKGVMLCTRPAEAPANVLSNSASSAAAPAYRLGNGDVRPFVATVATTTYTGLPPPRKQTADATFIMENPSLSNLRNNQARAKSDDVTFKHKQWLRRFQAKKQSMIENMSQSQQQIERKKQDFQERCRLMRQAIRRVRETDPSNVQAYEEALNSIDDKKQQLLSLYPDVTKVESPIHNEDGELSNQKLESSMNSKLDTKISSYDGQGEQQSLINNRETIIKTTGEQEKQRFDKNGEIKAGQSDRLKLQKVKPAWALTEEQKAELDNDEANKLLDFANNLDYDQYITDMEVKEALRFVQERVKMLEKQQEEEEGQSASLHNDIMECDVVDEQDGQNGMMKSLKKNVIKSSLSIDAEKSSRSQSMIAEQLAEQRAKLKQLQSEMEVQNRFRNIHSSSSVRALMESEKQRTILRNDDLSLNATTPNLAAAPLPFIATHNTRFSLHRAATVDASNLPFLYRHPAV